ncbi:hypothetical protein KIN20_017328 [Parelaphostrongylus tenuis]|uniref:Uncharacterized protein n=1 Tax=Parelaphostrongylus tenuis TaxID=148309 RepID=A0AAD5MZS8_PARTN|nr:hypothetical protein KIN20_017328 [Parelaphostrongylus tenuis]
MSSLPSLCGELETTNENKKLRGGIVDALKKIERYKSGADHTKEVCKEMAEQLGINEERIGRVSGLSHLQDRNPIELTPRFQR